MPKLYVNTIGKKIRFTPEDKDGAPIPLSDVGSPTVFVRSPTGVVSERVPVVEDDKLEIDLDGLIDVPGTYRAQLFADLNGWEGRATTVSWRVFGEFE